MSFDTVPNLVRANARRRPQHPAAIQDDARGARTLDHAAFDALVDRIAAALQRDGVQPRDAVAVCAANSIEYAAFFVGVLRAGGCVAPLPPSATPESIAQMRADSGSKLYFTDRELERVEDWAAPPGAQPAPVAIQPDWPFNIIYSSGTTGTPKGIVQPHAMRWAHVQRAAQPRLRPGSRSRCSRRRSIRTPRWSASCRPSASAARSILMAKFDVRGYLELAQKYRVTHTMLVPVQYQRLMAFPDFDRYDLSPSA